MPLPPVPGDRGGFALPPALAVLVLVSVLVVTVYANSMASFRSGTTDVGKSRSHFAAEAGAETGMAQPADALAEAILQDAELTFSTVKVGGVIPERITPSPRPRWRRAGPWIRSRSQRPARPTGTSRTASTT
jgi:Tfp pilus assembly protein PilX